MSCQLTDFEIIDQITTGLRNIYNSFDCCEKGIIGGLNLTYIENANALGKKLVGMNAKAYLARYQMRGFNWLKKNYNRRLYNYSPTKRITKIQLFGLLEYYIYQCEEFEQEPELLTSIKEIKNNLAIYIVREGKEYEALKWGQKIN